MQHGSPCPTEGSPLFKMGICPIKLGTRRGSPCPTPECPSVPQWELFSPTRTSGGSPFSRMVHVREMPMPVLHSLLKNKLNRINSYKSLFWLRQCAGTAAPSYIPQSAPLLEGIHKSIGIFMTTLIQNVCTCFQLNTVLGNTPSWWSLRPLLRQPTL